jgi:lipopolysaccharide exporter
MKWAVTLKTDAEGATHVPSLRGAVASGVTWTGTSAGLLFLLGFAQTATLAHFLHPRDFGLMAAIAVLLGLGQAFGDMGISSAIIARQTTSPATLSSLYWLNVLAGLIVFAILAASAPLIVRYYHQPRLSHLVPLAALIFVIRPFGQQFFVLLERDLNFRVLARIEVAAALTSTAAAITAAVAGAGVFALILGTLVQASVWSTLLIGRSLRAGAWRPKLHFRFDDVRGYLGFGLYQMGDRSVNFLSSNVDYLLIGRFLGIEALGAYSLAYQLVVKPVSALNPVVTRVAFPAFARRQNDDVSLRRGYLEMIRLIAFALMPGFVALSVTAPVLVPVLFGSRWHSAVVLIEILAFMALLRSLTNPVGSLMLARNRPDIGFKFNVVLLAVMAGALFWAVHTDLKTVAIVETAVVAAAFLAWNVIVRRTLALSLRDYFGAILSPLLFTGVAACLMLAARDVLANHVGGAPTLALTLLLGAGVYLALLIGLERSYVRRLVGLFLMRNRVDLNSPTVQEQIVH